MENGILYIVARYKHWGIGFVRRSGTVLVARADALKCVKHIYAEPHNFYGYDAFALLAAEKLQPLLEWSASYSVEYPPSIQLVISGIDNDPIEVTHYEFIFERNPTL